MKYFKEYKVKELFNLVVTNQWYLRNNLRFFIEWKKSIAKISQLEHISKYMKTDMFVALQINRFIEERDGEWVPTFRGVWFYYMMCRIED